MIVCSPESLFSWNFTIEGERHFATSKHYWLSEEGTLTIDGKSCFVRKHGHLSGRWTLDFESEQLAIAQKESVLLRSFEMRDSRGEMILRPMVILGRSFCLERDGVVVASLKPDHLFSRRTTIETSVPDLDFSTLCFSFWLVVMTWRRSTAANS